jgi:hypothetical protein
MNPAAPHHLPVFITAPGESDFFLNGAAVFLVVMVLLLGSVYFRLHALPEHMAHRNANKLQFEVVAVLALLALFTHNNSFWVAALLLALIPIPDFHGPLATMAESLAKMAGFERRARRDDLIVAPENEGIAMAGSVDGTSATSTLAEAAGDENAQAHRWTSASPKQAPGI